MTNKYEAAIVLSVAQGEDATAALKEKFNDLIAKHGTIENVDDWGKRRLAYEIEDETEGLSHQRRGRGLLRFLHI